MANTQKLITTLHAELPYLRTRFNVKKIGLFGSYATNNARPESDIDLLVEFSKPIGFDYFTMIAHLEKLLGKRVDVLTPAGVKSIRVSSVKRNIIRSVRYV